MAATPKLWKFGTGLRYKRKGLRASNRLLKTQTGTRLNALLLMRGTVIAQEYGSFRIGAAFRRNTTSESLSPELFELDSDVFVFAFVWHNAIVLAS